MKKSDIEILEKLNEQNLAIIYCTLNRLKWPRQLPDPPELYGPEKRRAPGGRGRRIMAWIVSKISHKQCLREWNRQVSRARHYHYDKFGPVTGS